MKNLLTFLKEITKDITKSDDSPEKQKKLLRSINEQLSHYDAQEFSLEFPPNLYVEGEAFDQAQLKARCVELFAVRKTLKAFLRKIDLKLEPLCKKYPNELSNIQVLLTIYGRVEEANSKIDATVNAFFKNEKIEAFKKETIAKAISAINKPNQPTVIARLWHRPQIQKLAGLNTGGHLTIQIYRSPEEMIYTSFYPDTNTDNMIDSPRDNRKKKAIDLLVRYAHLPKGNTYAGYFDTLESDYERLLFGIYDEKAGLSEYVGYDEVIIEGDGLYRLDIDAMYKKAKEKATSKNKKFDLYFNNCSKPIVDIFNAGNPQQFCKFPFSVSGLVGVERPNLVFSYIKNVAKEIARLNEPDRKIDLSENDEEIKEFSDFIEATIDQLELFSQIPNNGKEEEHITERKTNDPEIILNIKETLLNYKFAATKDNLGEIKDKLMKYINHQIKILQDTKTLNDHLPTDILREFSTLLKPQSEADKFLNIYHLDIQSKLQSIIRSDFSIHKNKNLIEFYVASTLRKLPEPIKSLSDFDILFSKDKFSEFAVKERDNFVGIVGEIRDFFLHSIKNTKNIQEWQKDILQKNLSYFKQLYILYTVFNISDFSFDLLPKNEKENTDKDIKLFRYGIRFKNAIRSTVDVLNDEKSKPIPDKKLIKSYERILVSLRQAFGFFNQHVYFDTKNKNLSEIKVLFPSVNNKVINSVTELVEIITASFENPVNHFDGKKPPFYKTSKNNRFYEAQVSIKISEILRKENVDPQKKIEAIQFIVAAYQPSRWKFWRHSEYKRYQAMERDASRICVVSALIGGYIDEMSFCKELNYIKNNLPSGDQARSTLENLVKLLKEQYIENEKQSAKYLVKGDEEYSLVERCKQELFTSYKRLNKQYPVQKYTPDRVKKAVHCLSTEISTLENIKDLLNQEKVVELIETTSDLRSNRLLF